MAFKPGSQKKRSTRKQTIFIGAGSGRSIRVETGGGLPSGTTKITTPEGVRLSTETVTMPEVQKVPVQKERTATQTLAFIRQNPTISQVRSAIRQSPQAAAIERRLAQEKTVSLARQVVVKEVEPIRTKILTGTIGPAEDLSLTAKARTRFEILQKKGRSRRESLSFKEAAEVTGLGIGLATAGSFRDIISAGQGAVSAATFAATRPGEVVKAVTQPFRQSPLTTASQIGAGVAAGTRALSQSGEEFGRRARLGDPATIQPLITAGIATGAAKAVQLGVKQFTTLRTTRSLAQSAKFKGIVAGTKIRARKIQGPKGAPVRRISPVGRSQEFGQAIGRIQIGRKEFGVSAIVQRQTATIRSIARPKTQVGTGIGSAEIRRGNEIIAKAVRTSLSEVSQPRGKGIVTIAPKELTRFDISGQLKFLRGQSLSVSRQAANQKIFTRTIARSGRFTQQSVSVSKPITDITKKVRGGVQFAGLQTGVSGSLTFKVPTVQAIQQALPSFERQRFVFRKLLTSKKGQLSTTQILRQQQRLVATPQPSIRAGEDALRLARDLTRQLSRSQPSRSLVIPPIPSFRTLQIQRVIPTTVLDTAQRFRFDPRILEQQGLLPEQLPIPRVRPPQTLPRLTLKTATIQDSFPIPASKAVTQPGIPSPPPPPPPPSITIPPTPVVVLPQLPELKFKRLTLPELTPPPRRGAKFEPLQTPSAEAIFRNIRANTEKLRTGGLAFRPIPT